MLTPLLDFVEAWNARLFVGDGNARAAEFAVEHELPGVASSDAHTVMEVGVAYTILDGQIDDATAFRAALAGGPRLVHRRADHDSSASECPWPSWSSACAAIAASVWHERRDTQSAGPV